MTVRMENALISGAEEVGNALREISPTVLMTMYLMIIRCGVRFVIFF